ncbi:MAG: T9SS type A sorting domain-containing protein [Bacteroidales bacterium]|nr:T9SS type A sorting domain-containing protein [Bacteroidales bacterium]
MQSLLLNIKRFTFLICCAILYGNSFAQIGSLLSFTAIDSAAYVQLDSIKVKNLTAGDEYMLYWPDTVFLYWVGIHEENIIIDDFRLSQNFPNPTSGSTNINIYMPERDMVAITITDISGKKLIFDERILEAGNHTFCFTPERKGIYFLSACRKNNSKSIKIISQGNAIYGRGSLVYSGYKEALSVLKSGKSENEILKPLFDEFLFIGYADGLESGIQDDVYIGDQTYTFQFATNIPCPGISAIKYLGQDYNTIQVFSQCWLTKNLNVGTMIEGNQAMYDNGILEKYCFDNLEENCDQYGGLYQWNEAMQYDETEGARGICPEGWHIPSNDEWKILEGAVDSQFGIGDPIWDEYDFRGFDAAENLKSLNGWYASGNGIDLYGFAVLPAGWLYTMNIFEELTRVSHLWSSSMHDYYTSYGRRFLYNANQSYLDGGEVEFGWSVRCLKDEIYGNED